MKKDPLLLDKPSNDWPAADDRPRTPWLNIEKDGPPFHSGAYEVAHWPYYVDQSMYNEEQVIGKQVTVMQWGGVGSSPFFFSKGSSLSGYSGYTWYRGLAQKPD